MESSGDSVAIVGAGLSGLTCARLLATKFDTVHLFDFGETRLQTGSFGDVKYEIGAMQFPSHAKNIGALVQELQLETFERIGQSKFFWDGKLVSREDIGHHAGIGDMSYDEITETYVTDYVKKLDRRVDKELDRYSARDLLDTYAPTEVSEFLECDLFGTITAPGLRHVSALQVVQYLRGLHGDAAPGCHMYQKLVDGNEKIIHAYKAFIKQNYLNVKWHNAKVTKVAKISSEGKLHYEVSAPGAFECLSVDELVLCTPLHMLPETIPALELPPIPYIAHLRIYLHLRERFWGNCGDVLTNDPEIGWVEDHVFGNETKTGVLELHLCGPPAVALEESGKSTEEMVAEAVRRLSKIWPRIAEQDMLLNADVKYWSHAISYFPPERRLEYRNALLESPIKLCGEHTAVQVGCIDGAMQAAVDLCGSIRSCMRAPKLHLSSTLKPCIGDCADGSDVPEIVDEEA